MSESFDLVNNFDTTWTNESDKKWNTFKSAITTLVNANAFTMVVHNYTYSISETKITISGTNQSNVVCPTNGNDLKTLYIRPGQTMTATLKFDNTIINNESDKVTLYTLDTLDQRRSLSFGQFNITYNLINMATDPQTKVDNHTMEITFFIPATLDNNQVYEEANELYNNILYLTVENLVGTLHTFPVCRMIVDTKSPSLESLTISSSNIFDIQKATKDDNITLKINAYESLQEPIGIIFTNDQNSINLTFTTGDDLSIWQATTQVDVNTIQGNVEFVIDYKDLAGNSSTCTHTNLTSNKVIVDTIPPKLSYYSKGESNNFALGFNENVQSAGIVIFDDSSEIDLTRNTNNNPNPKELEFNSSIQNIGINSCTNVIDLVGNIFNVSDIHTQNENHVITINTNRDIVDSQYFGTVKLDPSITLTVINSLEIYGSLEIVNNSNIQMTQNSIILLNNSKNILIKL